MSDDPLSPLTLDVRSSWQAFLDVFEPLRPELYRYCRHLTRSPWEAEDLVQEALMRAFVTLGTLFRDVPEPRAWLFRVASNSWIDRVRRARREDLHGDPATAPGAEQAAEPGAFPQGTREAAGTLLVRLSPQERAALVLKDVFDFSIDEIAETLSTSAGAVKAALHRGRGKLQTTPEPSSEPPRAPTPKALTAFCDAFNARDLDRLTNLLLDGATVEIVGVVTEYGREAPKDPHTGSFAGSLSPITIDERGGVAADLLEGYLGHPPRAEVRAYRNGWVVLFWYDHTQGPLVRTVLRIDPQVPTENATPTDAAPTNDADHEIDCIARVANYFFTPDVIAEVCTELGVPFQINGYRYWHPTG